jgi:hypothetical protein
VKALVGKINGKHGSIAGVWHTAVTLSDGMLDGLDHETLGKVLAPKVTGADNLHQATLGQPLEQFVMFSSASALIGNPGQGAMRRPMAGSKVWRAVAGLKGARRWRCSGAQLPTWACWLRAAIRSKVSAVSRASRGCSPAMHWRGSTRCCRWPVV